MPKTDTTTDQYTQRLVGLEYKPWKSLLAVQRPYRWNLKRLHPNKTLDIGCGIGRYLRHLPDGSVGIDHNRHSIDFLKNEGMVGFTATGFKKSKYAKCCPFDTLLLSHVLEHMTPTDGVNLIKEYAPFIKPRGQIIIFCPQEKGYASDQTHVNFLDTKAISTILKEAGFEVKKQYSFPFARPAGRFFTYNEFTVVGHKKN